MKTAAGFTTNERINYSRYKYFKSPHSSPFSLGWIQNIIDVINRRILWCIPVPMDWTRIYTLDDFYELIPLRLRRLASKNSSIHLLNI